MYVGRFHFNSFDCRFNFEPRLFYTDKYRKWRFNHLSQIVFKLAKFRSTGFAVTKLAQAAVALIAFGGVAGNITYTGFTHFSSM